MNLPHPPIGPPPRDYIVLLRVYRLLITSLHCILIGVLAWWVRCFVWPNPLFNNSISFRVFLEIMPRESWAWLFAVSATIGLVGLVARRSWLLIFSAATLGTTHGVIAVLVTWASTGSTGIGAYLGLAGVGYILVILRMMVNFE